MTLIGLTFPVKDGTVTQTPTTPNVVQNHMRFSNLAVAPVRVVLLFAAALLIAPCAEALTLLVYNNADSGAGSLRQAISDNNALGGGNTIIISNVVTGTITLTGGQLLISKNLALIGPGANVLAVSGNNANRVFYITNNATVSISGLTVSGGSVPSGGTYPTDAGGGIFNDRSTLTISTAPSAATRRSTPAASAITRCLPPARR